MAAIAVTTAGCGTQPKPLTVTALSFQFQPTTIEVHAGQPVKLTLRNTDVLEHDFQVDQLPMKAGSGSHAGHAGHDSPDPAALHVHSDAGRDTTTTFTPTQKGTYTVYCTVPGHKEAGMTATLVVR